MGAAVMFNMTQKMWLCPYIIVAISCLDFDLTQLISFPAFLCFDQMWTAEILCSIETITIGGVEQRRKKQQKKPIKKYSLSGTYCTTYCMPKHQKHSVLLLPNLYHIQKMKYHIMMDSFRSH